MQRLYMVMYVAVPRQGYPTNVHTWFMYSVYYSTYLVYFTCVVQMITGIHYGATGTRERPVVGENASFQGVLITFS